MTETERTLVLVKPDGVQRGLVGVILGRLEARGLKLIALKLLRVDEALARRHYAAHLDKPFFAGLLQHITSGPVVATVVEGEHAVEAVRQLMGATDPVKAAPGSVRGDLALNIGRNLIHGSDSSESAATEVALFFQPQELVSWSWVLKPWVTESG